MRRLYLAVEFSLLFFVLPLLFFFGLVPIHNLMGLFLGALLCGGVLWLSAEFDRSVLYRVETERRERVRVLSIFLLSSGLLTFLTLCYDKGNFLYLPRRHPGVWLAVMMLYPTLLVYPQELVYRGYFFHRYGALFPSTWMMVLASSVVFAFLHIVFRNWVALGLTFLGGIIFSVTYLKTRSVVWVTVEHALYGTFLFTVGLGKYFVGATLSEFLSKV